MPANLPNQSLQRGIQILFAVAGVEGGRTVQQIASRVGLKPNTTYRLIRSLEEEGMLRRKHKPLRFILGQAVSELKLLDDERHLLTLGGKILIRTQAKLPVATFSLGDMDGTNNYQRLCVRHTRPGVLVHGREHHVPIYEKASSLLFLAYCHHEEALNIYREHPFEEEGLKLWGSRHHLEDFLRQVRRRGYSNPEVHDQEGPHFRVAAPVFNHRQELTAAIGGFIYNDQPKKYRPQLIRLCVEGAKELTAQMQELDGGRRSSREPFGDIQPA